MVRNLVFIISLGAISTPCLGFPDVLVPVLGCTPIRHIAKQPKEVAYFVELLDKFLTIEEQFGASRFTSREIHQELRDLYTSFSRAADSQAVRLLMAQTLNESVMRQWAETYPDGWFEGQWELVAKDSPDFDSFIKATESHGDFETSYGTFRPAKMMAQISANLGNQVWGPIELAEAKPLTTKQYADWSNAVVKLFFFRILAERQFGETLPDNLGLYSSPQTLNTAY